MIKSLVSIVIRTWNRADDLSETLLKLKQLTYQPLEIVVVDNGSNDNTIAVVSSSFPLVKIVKLDKNFGVEATNIGIENSQGEYLIVLDDDAFLMPGAIEVALAKFSENERLGILAFKIIDFYSGLSPQTKDEKRRKDIVRKEGILLKVFQGGGFMMHRKLFDEVGGYPEDFFFVGEESDLAFRVLAAGWEIRYFPELIVIHKPSLKSRSLSRKTYYEIRNIIWLYWRYSPFYLAFIKTFLSIFILGFKALKNRSIVYFFKGIGDGLIELPKQFKKHKVVYTQTTWFFLISFIKSYKLKK
ncbi:MAG: glycosyltransferase family 2 protein [Nanoarchaeota archaeon]